MRSVPKNLILAALAAGICFHAPAVRAEEPPQDAAAGTGKSATSLKVGVKAPAFQPSGWVQGEPVKSFESDKVYLIEFWATWCGPCRATIPHLNALHRKFQDKGLVVIGQSFSEKDPDAVAAYVKKMGDQMTYRVTLDTAAGNEPGTMDRTWVKAAGIRSIPAAFLVDKTGTIAWIGHPQNLPEKTIDQVIAGTYKPENATDDREAKVKEFRERLKRSAELRAKIMDLVEAKEWDKAEVLVNEHARGKKDSFPYLRFYLARRDFAGAAECAAKIAAESPDTYSTQYTVLRELAYAGDSNPRLLDVAEAAGRRAIELQTRKTPNTYDGLARIRFLKGDREGAVEFATEAKACNQSERAGQRFQQAIDLYKQGKIPEGDLMMQLRGIYQGYEKDKTRVAVREAPAATAQPAVDPLIGQKAPPFTAKLLDGKEVKFPDDYKGKIVLLDFWATWCGPCVAEMPNVVKAYGNYHDKGLEVLGISLDRENQETKLADFLKKKEIPWPQVYDGGYWNAAVAKLYGIKSIPHMMLVDGDTGVILANRTIRGEALAAAIEKALAERQK